MFFQHARKSVAGTLAAAVLAASTATQGCTSVTRKDVWKPEKEFSETLPAGESTQERLAYEISATHSARNAGTLEVVVQEAKYQEQYQNFQVVGKVREKKWVEEQSEFAAKFIYEKGESYEPVDKSLGELKEGQQKGAISGGLVLGILGIPTLGLSLGALALGQAHELPPAAWVGIISGGALFTGIGWSMLANDDNYYHATSEHPTDELRISEKSQRPIKNKTGQQTLYTAKPAASIEVIAESDFYAINGSGRTSVYTGADGRVSLLIGLPRGYAATEQELMQELMRRAEAGSMPLSDIRGYKTRAHVEHEIRLRTNAQPESGRSGSSTAVDNAERSITLPVYKLPE